MWSWITVSDPSFSDKRTNYSHGYLFQQKKGIYKQNENEICIHTHSPTEIIISREKSTYKDLTNQRLDELSMHGINRSVNKSFETTVRVSLSLFFFNEALF